MGNLNIPSCVTKWTKAFLSDRRARVKFGHAISEERVMQEGLPQGSVLAPLFWLIYINDICPIAEEGICWSLYADDVALLATGRS